ncbi:MAG: hypothetical protein ACE5JU_20170 [Candidatus Binatia bacterium]
MRHYHIITCDSPDVLGQFDHSGWAGVRPITYAHGARRPVQMNWDILADLARVRSGDFVVLHSQGLLKGVYEAGSSFLVPDADADLFDGPTLLKSAWEAKGDDLRLHQQEYRWWLKLSPSDYYFQEYAPVEGLFSLIADGTIRTLPQRLRYEDKNKTVKGLHKYDFSRVVDVLLSANPVGTTAYSSEGHPFGAANTPPFRELSFVLTEDGYEKNLEAVLVHTLRTQAERFRDAVGQVDCVLNTLPLGYLGMADIVTWATMPYPNWYEHVYNLTVWELKARPLARDLIVDVAESQLLRYLNEVTRLFPPFVSVSHILQGVMVGAPPTASLEENVLPSGHAHRLTVLTFTVGEDQRLDLVRVLSR